MKFIKSIYLSQRVFIILLGFIVLFIISYLYNPLFIIVKYLFAYYLFMILIDFILLYVKKGVTADRILAEKFSNGEENPVELIIKNNYAFNINISIIDEIPFQFQVRNFLIKAKISKKENKRLYYNIKPTKRGVYNFGKLNIYVESIFGLIKRRYIFCDYAEVVVYPNFSQIKKYDLISFNSISSEYGLKKIRRIGSTTEFDQIKDYILGDDFRNINWKATARKNNLMVNIFQDERSQPIYSVIDKSRIMLMPFGGLSLLDYAINSSLIISSTAINKNDKAGIITFSNKIHDKVIANRRNTQMNLILETLYKINPDNFESDFERLYIDIKRTITRRSLIFIYTNFESINSLDRQISYLKGIAKNHLLVVIFFKNSELNKMMITKPKNTKEIYHQIVAEKFNFDKNLIVNKLKHHGIFSILTEPKNLTVNVINKYLELKARSLI